MQSGDGKVTIGQFHILHTNDLHSDFKRWAKVTSCLEQRRSQLAGEVLLFDIGDHADRVDPLTESSSGRANVTMMNQVGYHGVTIGNNEGITFSKIDLEQLYEDANFPVIIANLFDENGRRPSWVKPFNIITLKDGLKIGVIGLTIPFYSFYKTLGWEIMDPFLVIESLIKDLRKEADVIILLSHLGLNYDEQIAKQFEGIDVILGGHTHDVLLEGKRVNETLIAQAGKFGKFVGQVSISYDLNERKVRNVEAVCHPVEPYKINENTEKMITQLAKNELNKLKQDVAILKEPINVSWQKPSPFGYLMAKALKDWCQADIGMVNSGVLLESLPIGPVTKEDLHRLCPHPINPGKVMIKGNVLKETILHALTKEMINKKINGFGFRGEIMGVMEFDGVEYETEVMEDGLVHVKSITVNGEPLRLEASYSVATIDIFLFSNIYSQIAASKEKQYYMPEFLRDLLMWQLQR